MRLRTMPREWIVNSRLIQVVVGGGVVNRILSVNLSDVEFEEISFKTSVYNEGRAPSGVLSRDL